jgi:hypothetical protein
MRPRLGQINDLGPESNPLDVDRLYGAPVPDDVEVVEALVADVAGHRLQRRLVLGGHEVLTVEFNIHAEIALSTEPKFFQQRDRRAQDAQLDPAPCMGADVGKLFGVGIFLMAASPRPAPARAVPHRAR